MGNIFFIMYWFFDVYKLYFVMSWFNVCWCVLLKGLKGFFGNFVLMLWWCNIFFNVG